MNKGLKEIGLVTFISTGTWLLLFFLDSFSLKFFGKWFPYDDTIFLELLTLLSAIVGIAYSIWAKKYWGILGATIGYGLALSLLVFVLFGLLSGGDGW